jgi:hypothetical protein
MSYGIELLREDDAVLAGPADVAMLARPFRHRLPGGARDDVAMRILLEGVPAPPYVAAAGMPRHANPEWGSVVVELRAADGGLVYSHPHALAEIIADGLLAWAAGQAPYVAAAWRLVGPKVDGSGAVRATPAVQGATLVAPFAHGERRPFKLSVVAQPPPDEVHPAALGVQPLAESWRGATRTRKVKVVIDPRMTDELLYRAWSEDSEEGGFLVGRVWRDAGEPDTFLAQITAALPARSTGASLLRLTFTGDAYLEINREIDRNRPGEALLGWYHSHLFAASDDLGLSTTDYVLHFNTFRQPWQIAGLINLDGDRRVLRFYARDGDALLLCPMLAPERAT